MVIFFKILFLVHMTFLNTINSLITTGRNISTVEENSTSPLYRKFPDGFLFGVATSSYQVEGAWNDDDKGPSIWDQFVHEDPTRITNEDNGDEACDFYRKYKGDVKLAADMGLHHFRFSISWPRILPNGYDNKVNGKGIKFYQNIVDECLKNGLIPVATIHHWDLPIAIQELGGFMNPEMVDPFVNYARIVIESLPDVGYWVTINEPKQICLRGYGIGDFAPGIKKSGIGEYLCAYVISKAHAATYRMYKKEFPQYKAPMTIVIDGQWNEPMSNKTEDVEAAQRKNQFEFGLYANPIFNGDWPQEVIDRVNERSKIEHFHQSRLPKFTPEEIQFINGTWDFMGFNTYFTSFVLNDDEPSSELPQSFDNDVRAKLITNHDYKTSSCGNLIVPWGATKMLKWIKDTYNNPPIFIAENGVCDDGTSLVDYDRIQFYQGYLNAILNAIYEDGVDVFAYTAWSLLDNFEWINGYSAHYGLYHINHEDPEKKRSPKKSVGYFRDVSVNRELPRNEDLKSYLN